ncbi:MAG: exodeoxyribonuclease VII small subunit [Acidimicrobiales bacterium]
MSPGDTAGDDRGDLSFEALLEKLESLVGQLSSGEVGIEAAADLYEQAGLVYAEAKGRLDAVQARIDALRVDPPG